MVGLNRTLEPNIKLVAWAPKCKEVRNRVPMEDRLYHMNYNTSKKKINLCVATHWDRS
jgi:hypothetical protein